MNRSGFTILTLVVFLILPMITNAQKKYPKAVQSNMKQFKAWSDRAAKAQDERTRKDYAKRAAKYLSYAKKKAPDFDFSIESKLVSNILEGNVSLSGKSLVRQQRGFMSSYYEKEGTFFNHNAFFRPKFLEDSKQFDKEKGLAALAEMGDSPDVIVKDFAHMINDYGAFLDRTDLRSHFMNKFNKAGGHTDTKNPAYTLTEAKKIKAILAGIQKFVGKQHNTLNDLNTVADEMISENMQLLRSVVTSDFHLENVGNVLFSNKPVKIGSESPNDFKISFTPEEAIYATMYLGRTLESMFAGDAISKKGVHLTPLYINDGNVIATGPNEGWEVMQFMAKDNICYPAANLSQSYFQFIVVPNKTTDMSSYIKVSNFTPVTFMHGLSRTSGGVHNFTMKTNKPDRNGVVTNYSGTFSIDMSKNGGKNYYNTFKEEVIYDYIKDVPWPIAAAFRDANLESKAIKVMSDMIPEMNFKSARITSRWQEKLVFGVKERSIDIAVAGGKNIDPNKPKAGYCYYRVFTFIDTRSGLQRKSSGPMTRVTCDKIK